MLPKFNLCDPFLIISLAKFPLHPLNSIRTRSLTKMSYFVIGVSGVTCGGKTTLTKLLQRSFPWCRIIHQDTYFYLDDWPHHIRLKEVENHVNYEVMGAMDMDKMYKDIQVVLDGPGEFFDGRNNSKNSLEEVPNFDTGLELLKTVKDLDFDTKKYNNIPILILEGFTLFESQFIFDKCDVRLFASLEEEECRKRRESRVYEPPDCEGYFDKVVWPEYRKHFEGFVNNKKGIKVFSGTTKIERVWEESVQIIGCRLEEKYFQ